MEPAIGVLELNSIVQGIHVADQMCKTADIELIDSFPVCPGKYMVLVTGDVGAVKKAVKTGESEAKEFYVDSLLIPNIHPDIIPAIQGATNIDTSEINSVGALESFSIASCIVAADIAAKEASVKLIEIRLAKGLG
ncbi:MAG TPA: BMC domain-containing protein, partial [Firmicutes bacterium]|nr:BMC domain-containing protein [Bacillota bacterium]